jgi:hypothetical protein
MSPISKRQQLQALACFAAVPAVAMAHGVVFRLLDPELARGHADYARNFRLIEMARTGVSLGTAGILLVLWIATCYLVLKGKGRSPGWITFAFGGPLGFSVIAALEDLAPAPGDLYERWNARLKMGARLALGIALFLLAWNVAFEGMVLIHDLMVAYESHATGTPVATILAQQDAESGMRAFGEGMEVMYLVVLFYLVWPIAFNLVGRAAVRRTA